MTSNKLLAHERKQFSAEGTMDQSAALEGITVLDLGQIYNAPYAGFLLANAGARVIKVESLIGETLRECPCVLSHLYQ